MAVKLDQYISELLFEHECVIIPGFGGIVSNYRSSFLNPAQHTFSPPSKRLAFNASLRTNDGLLAAHISKRLAVNYNEASAYIKSFVEDCMKSLQDGEKLILDKVGVLYFDKENNLQFMPDSSANYLKLSFGLASLHSPAIRKDNPLHIVDERTTARPKKKKMPKWKFIEVIPVAAMLTYLIVNPGVVNSLNEQAASLFSLGNKVEKLKVTVPVITKSENNYSYEEPTVTDAPEAVKEKITEEAPVINLKSSVATEELAAIDETKVETNTPSENQQAVPASGTYYIIGGCFRIEENAEKFLQQSIADGFQASIIGKNDHGLTMVSLYSSDSPYKADIELKSIREKANGQAWIFHN